MKILSIDVGIKNLAYCLFYIHKTKSIEIDSWDVINLTNDNSSNKCCGKYKNNSPCTHQAKYYYDTNYYCKVHAKKSNYIIPKKHLQKTYIAKQKLNEIKNMCANYELDISGCRVKKDYIDLIQNFLQTRVFKPVEQTNASNVNLVILGRNINTMFNTVFDKHKIDCVIIENQISPIANRMKTLQGMIAQYFIMKNIQTIEFVSSANKLKGIVTNPKKLNYKERKQLGIETIHTLAIKNPFLSRWLDFFVKHKKKDDLADCFLQGLWYLRENKLYLE